MSENITLNSNQTQALKQIVKSGKVTVGAGHDIDGRTARSLASKGLVKVNETKAGIFAVATAKGKKISN